MGPGTCSQQQDDLQVRILGAQALQHRGRLGAGVHEGDQERRVLGQATQTGETRFQVQREVELQVLVDPRTGRIPRRVEDASKVLSLGPFSADQEDRPGRCKVRALHG